MNLYTEITKLRDERERLVMELAKEAMNADGTFETAKEYLEIKWDEAVNIDSMSRPQERVICPIDLVRDAKTVVEAEFKGVIEKMKKQKVWGDTDG